MKISFLGAGAIGSMFGGLLQRSSPGADVRLIVRGDHGASLRKRQAVDLLGPWGMHSVPIKSDASVENIAGSQFVFVTVKSQDTCELMQQAAPYLGDAIVVSIQNGINDETLAPFVPADRLVMGVTSTNMAITEPGRVSMQLDGATLFGGPHGQAAHGAAQKACQLFDRVNIPGLLFATSNNVLGVRYNKLTINALGYASCISASNFINEALAYKPWRDGVGQPIVQECRKVYAAANTTLDAMPGRSDIRRVEKLMNLFGVPVVGHMIRLAIRKRFDRTPIVFSLFQDLKRGKPTEVDHINGQVVQLAKKVNQRAPVNEVLVRMVHELEGKPNPQFFTREDVIRRVSSTTNSLAR